MKNSLPSLNAIRFFECAARHSSFTRAAEELFVTQGAVSKQIKLLEEQLGCSLFSRKGPRLILTQHGEELLATVSEALRIIQQGVGRLQRASDTTLTLSVLPSFASIWLMPKIMEFEAKHPTISVRQTASFDNIDFDVDTDIDASIRLGDGDWPGLYTRQLTRDRLLAVAPPAIAQTIGSIEDLSQQTLLIDPHPRLIGTQFKLTDTLGEWQEWFDAAGQTFSAKDTRVMDETGTLIRACLLGQGVGLLREELIADYLQSGLLLSLFDVEYYSNLHYYFVCPMSRKDETKIDLFRHWLERVGK